VQKKDLKYIGYLVAGGIALDYFLNQSSQPVAQTVDTSLLGTITSGVSNLVGTLTGNKQQDFITQMTPVAAQIQQQYGIDPLVTMTQAALESGWGTSGLTKQANNLYGYTGDDALNAWLVQQGVAANTDMGTILGMDTSAAPFIMMQTHESSPTHALYFTRPNDIISQTQNADGSYDLMVWRPFRKYDSWLSSVQDWAHLIATSPRYAAAYADAKAGDANSFANDVAAAGYATETDYASQLVSVADEISGIQSA
jgi:flagellum-specific peptidoglycan hydrolase FlgJ